MPSGKSQSLILQSLIPQALKRRLHFTWRYLRGKTPWDTGIVPPEITAWIDAHESAKNSPGRALDLGCGTGTTSRFLAQHGWTVTGIDFAPNAIRRARREARRQGITAQTTFISADVSRPDVLADAPPVDLVIDIGCLHSLTPDQRAGYAANITRLTRPGAVYLLYAFMPQITDSGRRVGIDAEGLRTLLGSTFEIIDITLGEEATSPRPSGWYTLRRRDKDQTP